MLKFKTLLSPGRAKKDLLEINGSAGSDKAAYQDDKSSAKPVVSCLH